MKLSKANQLAIAQGVIKGASELTNKQQEAFIGASIKIETELNEALEDLLSGYKKEVAPFIIGDIPFNPGNGNTEIDSTTVKVKEVLQNILSTLTTVSNSGVKILMLASVKKGLEILQRSSITQEVLIKRIIEVKEN